MGGVGGVKKGKEGQGSALDPLGPEAPDPHSLSAFGKGGRSGGVAGLDAPPCRRRFMVEGAGVSDPCWGPGQSPGLLAFLTPAAHP